MGAGFLATILTLAGFTKRVKEERKMSLNIFCG